MSTAIRERIATTAAPIVVGKRLVSIPPSPQVGAEALLKRVFDLVVASLILVAMLPLVFVLALFIAFESGWPIFFTQKRLGLGGRELTVFKFRSMYKDAESRLPDLLINNQIKDGPTFKWREDPRITRVGRILRKTSLDELPQILNVIKGEMSLVGPRPPLRREVMKYEDWQLQRLSVKPGMTGLWQVSGRSDLSFVEMVELDIQYVNTWSFKQDVILLLRTPIAVVTARGAY